MMPPRSEWPILTTNPQDLTHPELEFPVKAAMRMQEPSRQVYLDPAA